MKPHNLTKWLHNLDLFGANLGRSEFNLNETLEHLRHILPNQGPIKDFIAHNTLHGFQSVPFHEGLSLAGSLFGAKSYLDLEVYESLYQTGKITESHLDFTLNSLISDPEIRKSKKQELLNFSKQKETRPPDVSNWGLRNYWSETHQIDITELVTPVLCKWLGNYLDQGISFWPMPSRKDSLWLSLGELSANSWLPLLPFSNHTLKNKLKKSAELALLEALEKLVGEPQFFSRYLLETLLCFPGWGAMICSLETNPSVLRKPSSASLLDFLALVLTLEVLFLDQKLDKAFHVPNYSVYLRDKRSHLTSQRSSLNRYWQEAYEWSFYDELFRGLISQNANGPELTPSPWAQAIFCIDDRECSIRRHLESIDPGITTFGTAGFFGIDFWFLGYEERYPLKQSPVTLEPKHLVRAFPKKETKRKKKSDGLLDVILGDLFSDLFLVPFLSVRAISQLINSIFLKKNNTAIASSLNQFDSQVMLEFKASEEESKDTRFKLGFTVEEMTERVEKTLRTIGLTQNFSDCIYVVAHGGSSANNPHFAAYDCGACSGKSGAPNSRALAWMANYAPVRAKLKERGIHIPEKTVFYAVLHDTTQDKCLFFEEDLESQTLPPFHQKFRMQFHKALLLNAKERARRFELMPAELSLEKTAEMVVQRAHSIFEPRPELTHTNNAAAIVGGRYLTRNLFLDRRAFLQSYDSSTDPEGEILEGILGAVIPVCGGINLQYFFSRIDNEKYGAGTKLSHNVVGLIGVSNGVNKDLISGLPSQMVEIHEPLRLMLLIEQEPELISQVLKRKPFLFEWVENNWIHLSAFSPTRKEISIWEKGGWLNLKLGKQPAPPNLSTDIMELARARETLPISTLNKELRKETSL
jgi:uncharacterized protein YbcC (UPF0753/DUF2309 family)